MVAAQGTTCICNADEHSVLSLRRTLAGKRLEMNITTLTRTFECGAISSHSSVCSSAFAQLSHHVLRACLVLENVFDLIANTHEQMETNKNTDILPLL